MFCIDFRSQSRSYQTDSCYDESYDPEDGYDYDYGAVGYQNGYNSANINPSYGYAPQWLQNPSLQTGQMYSANYNNAAQMTHWVINYYILWYYKLYYNLTFIYYGL